jgi:hypothetical protein
MNRSGNGQDRQPQKVSRAADDTRFIKPSENLAQATDSARICRTQVFPTMDAPQQFAAVTYEQMFSVGVLDDSFIAHAD